MVRLSGRVILSWCTGGAVENKSGQNRAITGNNQPGFSTMLINEDCVQNVSDVGE